MIQDSIIGSYYSVMAGNTAKIYYLNKDFKSVPIDEAVFVKKVIHKKYHHYDFITKEVFWLQKLSSFDRTPNIISFNNNAMIMTYMGTVITKDTIPPNWKNQIEYIIKTLELLAVSHNDIQLGEILVKDKKINLIDFQHATSTREEFRKLREKGKATVQQYVKDDCTSLYAEITKILGVPSNESK